MGVSDALKALALQKLKRCEFAKNNPSPIFEWYGWLAMIHLGGEGGKILASQSGLESFMIKFCQWRRHFDQKIARKSDTSRE